MTKQRKLILTTVSGCSDHLTVDQVFERARKAVPNIGKGTVYRNLNILADEGAIKRLQIPGQPVRFDGRLALHQHMVCIKCGTIYDIGDINTSEIQKLVGPQAEIVDHTLFVYAVCPKCHE